MIRGIHHISMKCATKEDADKVKSFYGGVLGLKLFREWEGGFMLDTCSGLIEVFTTGQGESSKGVIRHVALLTDDVDETADRVRAAGYEILIEPNNREFPSSPKYGFRMAFCRGPLGEEIELFCQK